MKSSPPRYNITASSDQGLLSNKPVISLVDASLSLPSPSGHVSILDRINLNIPAGQTVAILGPSGAGKTILLMIMSGLESLSSGQAKLAGHDITMMDEDRLAQLRREHVGIVFQAFRLIPSMTALQNVAVPLQLASDADAFDKAADALDTLGLGHRQHHLPDQLSGGEQQRVAIARAIIAKPHILLADEPTGNLDGKAGALVIDTLFSAARSVSAALMLITHDENLAMRCQRMIRIHDGRLIADEIRSSSEMKISSKMETADDKH